MTVLSHALIFQEYIIPYHTTLHNEYIREYDSPVSKTALYMLQGNNRISLYIRRILACYAQNLIFASGNLLQENI